MLLLVLIVVTFSGCESNESNYAKDIVGTWRMESAENLITGVISPVEESRDPYWEFLSNGVLVIYEGTNEWGQYRWEIVDSKLAINGNFSNAYTIVKLTKSKLDLGIKIDGDDAIYHFVKANQ